MTATNPIEAIIFEAVVSDTTAPEIVSMEDMPSVPTAPRSPRPKQSFAKEK